jgi:hypothetical protein
MDNARKLMTPLDEILQDHDVGTIYIMGIATDYCKYPEGDSYRRAIKRISSR